jgi:hypothetical protein
MFLPSFVLYHVPANLLCPSKCLPFLYSFPGARGQKAASENPCHGWMDCMEFSFFISGSHLKADLHSRLYQF